VSHFSNTRVSTTVSLNWSVFCGIQLLGSGISSTNSVSCNGGVHVTHERVAISGILVENGFGLKIPIHIEDNLNTQAWITKANRRRSLDLIGGLSQSERIEKYRILKCGPSNTLDINLNVIIF
jgi:hypothetical protein